MNGGDASQSFVDCETIGKSKCVVEQIEYVYF